MRTATYQRYVLNNPQSLEDAEALDDWAIDKGSEVDRYYDGPGAETTTSPGIWDLLAAVETGKYDTVVFARLSSPGRDLMPLGLWVQQLDAMNIRFVSLAEGLDTSTEFGKKLLQFWEDLVEAHGEVRGIKVRIASTGPKGQRYERNWGCESTLIPKLSEERRQRIVAMYNAGRTGEEIASAVNLSRCWVYRLLKENKDQIRYRQPK